MTDHSDLIAELGQRWEATDAPVAKKINRLLRLAKQAASALSSQPLSLSEAREEIERLKGLVAGIREIPQEPVGWTFEFLGYDGEWGRAFAFFDQGEPANGSGAIVRNVVPVRRAA